MDRISAREFFGFAIIVDLRNFSEICRRLLIEKRPAKQKGSNDLKRDIYSIFFRFLTSTLDTVTQNNRGLVFDYKHTGDGFLFITNHNKPGVNSISAFCLLLNVYSILNESIPTLNTELNTILWDINNESIIANSVHLSYIKNLFTDYSTKRAKHYINFSVGAHCGRIFCRNFDDKVLFLGNTINLAARFQELSKTFYEFNFFFSHDIKNQLKKYIKDDDALPFLEMLDLRKIEIRGIGPTKIYTIPEEKIAKVIKYCDDQRSTRKPSRKR